VSEWDTRWLPWELLLQGCVSSEVNNEAEATVNTKHMIQQSVFFVGYKLKPKE